MKTFLIAVSALTLTASASFAQTENTEAEVVGDHKGQEIHQVTIEGHAELPQDDEKMADEKGSAMEEAAFTKTCGSTDVKIVSRQLIEQEDAVAVEADGDASEAKVFNYNLSFICN